MRSSEVPNDCVLWIGSQETRYSSPITTEEIRRYAIEFPDETVDGILLRNGIMCGDGTPADSGCLRQKLGNMIVKMFGWFDDPIVPLNVDTD